jgi:hypothetical protein
MRRFAWLMAATVVLFSACSGKGSSATVATTTTPTAAAGAPDTATTTPSFSGSKNSKFCNLARQFSQSLTPQLASNPKAGFQQFDTYSSQFLAAAPSEIKSDAQTVFTGIRQIEARLTALNYDTTKLTAADLAPLQDPKFTTALNRINAYDTQVCGLTTAST